MNMENTLLKFATEPEFFANLDQNTVIEIYSFDTSEVNELFRLGDEYISLDNFRFELHRKNKTSEIVNIFITFNNLPADKVKTIAQYFESDQKQMSEIEEMGVANLIFAIREEVIEEIIQPYYDKPEKSLELFRLLDNHEDPVLLNFKYYKPDGINKA